VLPRESQPPPEFLVDRSLGAVIVPNALVALGLVVHTLRSVYGEAKARDIDDEVWLQEAGSWQRMNAFADVRTSSPRSK
jgi:hypothetical protein